MAITFLDLAEVLEIHREQISRYGGDAGVRDMNLLQSALGVPHAQVAGRYLHEDLYEMAAAYLFHIVQNHPFIDGNKRTGAVAALVFLDLNGVTLAAGVKNFEQMVWAVAKGEADKSDVAQFFRINAGDSRERR